MTDHDEAAVREQSVHVGGGSGERSRNSTEEGSGDVPDADLGGEAVGWIRAASKRVTGGNCTFVDDDLHVLEALALAAVKAGLATEVVPNLAARAAEAAACHPWSTGGTVP